MIQQVVLLDQQFNVFMHSVVIPWILEIVNDSYVCRLDLKMIRDVLSLTIVQEDIRRVVATLESETGRIR